MESGNNDQEVQEIFNKVINAGYYTGSDYGFMCLSLSVANNQQVITAEERFTTIEEIANYIGSHITLMAYLESLQLPYRGTDRLKIYQDWANRPHPTAS
jgi:hypothetical protein